MRIQLLQLQDKNLELPIILTQTIELISVVYKNHSPFLCLIFKVTTNRYV